MKPLHDALPTLISSKLRIVVTTHHRPDADAIGSSIALTLVLQKMGHHVTNIVPNQWASNLDWIVSLASNTVIYEEQKKHASECINACDWIFALDYNIFRRTKDMEKLLASCHKTKILIDHHAQPETALFDYGIADITKSSTAEMVHDWIKASDLLPHVDEQVMQAIYAGIIGDTGSFAYPSTTANALEIASSFKQHGLATHLVYERLFQNNSLRKIRFTGYALGTLMTTFEQHQVALISVPQTVHQDYQLQTGDMEGLVNIPLSIQSIRSSALVVQIDKEACKWSFRSLGKIDVNSFARNHFNGGGHINAAGGFSTTSLEKAIDKFKDLLPHLTAVS